MPHLLILQGPNSGKPLALDRDKTLLGRDKDCHVQLEQPWKAASKNSGSGGRKHENTVSRKHAVITRDQGKYFIEDGDGSGKKSRNGTFVNGVQAPFPERVPLKDNDVIKICDVTLMFQAEESGSSSTYDASISHDDSSQFLTGPSEKLQLLLEISNRLSHTLDFDSLLTLVVERLLQLFKQAESGFLILVDETSGELDPRIIKTRRETEAPPRFSASIVRQCLATVQALLSNNVTEQFAGSDSVAGLALKSVMCAPLWSQDDKAFGVLLVDSTSKKRKFTQEDLNLLMGVASQASIAVTNARFHREALLRERLNRDLALARQVARSFLPAEMPTVPGYEFFACNEPAQAVGGDYYDFIELDGERLGILLGDVTGKGVAAALVTARFSAQARACLRAESNLVAAIGALNVLMQPLGLTDRFMTLAALDLDAKTHTVTMVNAGHPSPLVLRREGGAIEEVNASSVVGLPLGVMDYEYQAHQIVLRPGDNLIVFSDGVTEALDKNGKQFGPKRLRACLQNAQSSPRELGERIIGAVQDHAAGCSQFDDITLVCLGRTE